MKNLLLVNAALWRKPARTVLTMLGVVIAFFLFGVLQGVDSAFQVALGRMKLDRVFVDPRFSQPMPLSYLEKIQKVPGVRHITGIAFMDGQYQDPKNSVLVIATTPALWLRTRPEYSIAQEQLDAISHIRNGVIVTDWLARRYGWNVGDQFTLRTRKAMSSGSLDWPFVVAGIMTYPDPAEQLSLFLANFEYIDESRLNDRGTVNRFLLQIDDPRRSAGICRDIDDLFIAAGVQTRTQSEQEMGQSQLASIGDVSFFTRAILGAVFFTLLIVTGNTMMESVRERRSELAVLRTLGFTDAAVLWLLIVESIVICVVASLIGLALAATIFPLASSYADIGSFPPVVVAAGVLIALGVALISTVIPAFKALRLSITDGLTAR